MCGKSLFFSFCVGVISAIIPRSSCLADGQVDAFIIRIFDRKVQVASPPRFKSPLHLVVENKSVVSFLGKVENVEGRLLSYVKLPPTAFRALELSASSTDRLFFIPLSPPSQAIELVVGKKMYEIPPSP